MRITIQPVYIRVNNETLPLLRPIDCKIKIMYL